MYYLNKYTTRLHNQNMAIPMLTLIAFQFQNMAQRANFQPGKDIETLFYVHSVLVLTKIKCSSF